MANIESTEKHLAPIRKSVVVRRTPEEAFEIFTQRMASWWPLATHSCFEGGASTCQIEPRVGGKVQEISKSGESALWGTIRVWEPPSRFVMSWHPGHNPETPTEVEFRFLPVEGGTRVELEHRDWIQLGAMAEKARAGYNAGWVEVFEVRFSEACVRD
jgi:uncharacterized protein YndB with AHSA1/START domain